MCTKWLGRICFQNIKLIYNNIQYILGKGGNRSINYIDITTSYDIDDNIKINYSNWTTEEESK